MPFPIFQSSQCQNGLVSEILPSLTSISCRKWPPAPTTRLNETGTAQTLKPGVYRRIFLDGFWAWSLASHLVEILRWVGTRSASHRLKSKTSGVAARSHGIFANQLGASGTAGPLRDSVYPRWMWCGFIDFHGRGFDSLDRVVSGGCQRLGRAMYVRC